MALNFQHLHGPVAWIWSLDMEVHHGHGHAACSGTCSMDGMNMNLDMPQGRIFSIDMNLDMQHILVHVHVASNWDIKHVQVHAACLL